MSDWRLTADSSIYKEALRATESLEEPALGFVKPSEAAQRDTSIIIKQNNTIIQLLVKIKEELEDCKDQIRELRRAKALEGSDTSEALEQIQNQLKNLSLGPPSTSKRPTITRKFFVYRDRKKIYEEEKKKIP
ncbi:ORF II [Rhynchospora pubera]|uniref:ORF II n=1 Tax=Rhynchospora pubera TaxID=906938 RepID=A0AAV8DVN9_9POAL|nr:ORF II [Rhynchospora pubera]